jgi:TatA/E family protein of Tat protein translocase
MLNTWLTWNRRSDMFDSKMLLVILAIALVIFGTKRLRTIGTDLGAAVKGFKQAMNDGESEETSKATQAGRGFRARHGRARHNRAT